MHLGRHLLFEKRRYLFPLILLSLISGICAAFSITGNTDFDIARREILLRRIGHEILLQSGDNTSRVLPVKEIAENEYQIAFENELAFRPDSLISTTQRLLAKDRFASDYVVNVLNCGNPNVVYGYAVSKNKKDAILSCIGRNQPKACYRINIKFKPAGMQTVKRAYLLGSLPFLAFVGFIFLRSVKPRSPLLNRPHMERLTLGSVLFDPKDRTLVSNGKTIRLTGTESRLLLIFASSPNEILERSQLQKEIWEDEGIIVGRSLDMFISKLRKKLESDPNIKILVVRGKGYKLDITV